MSTEFPKQQTHDWILETGLLLGWWGTLFWSCPDHCWWFPCTWWGLSRCWWGCWLWRKSWWQCCRGRWSWRKDQCILLGTPAGRESEFYPIFPCTTWMWWSSEILCQWQRSETRLLQFWTHSFPFWPDILVICEASEIDSSILTEELKMLALLHGCSDCRMWPDHLFSGDVTQQYTADTPTLSQQPTCHTRCRLLSIEL